MAAIKETIVALKKVVRECLHFNYDEYSGDMSLDVELTAENMIAHGVTVQEWISVKDRLPTAEDALLDGSVYAYTKAKKVLVLHYQYVCRRSDYILCWMPIALPEPPKGDSL